MDLHVFPIPISTPTSLSTEFPLTLLEGMQNSTAAMENSVEIS